MCVANESLQGFISCGLYNVLNLYTPLQCVKQEYQYLYDTFAFIAGQNRFTVYIKGVGVIPMHHVKPSSY